MKEFIFLVGLVCSFSEPLPPSHMLNIALLGKEKVAPKANTFGQPDWCDNFVPFLGMAPEYEPFLPKSGKSVDDFGLWEACRDLQSTEELTPRYDLYIFTLNKQLPMKWGLCYPEVCTQTLRTAIRTNLGTTLEFGEPKTDDFGSLNDDKAGSIGMICLVAVLGLLGIFGIFIQATSIGDMPQNYKVQSLDDTGTLNQKRNGINQSEYEAGSDVRSFQANNALLIRKEQQEPIQEINQSPSRQTDPIEIKSWPWNLLACFSLTYNMKKILFRSRPKSVTDSLDGIRVLSIFWVVLGHAYIFPLQLTGQNMIEAISDYSKQFFFGIVSSGVLAVDTFFFMSAFLGAFIFLNKFKAFSISKILIAYFHRYYRLTPILAVILYFSTYVIFPLTTGPYRQQIVKPNIENCKTYGWTVILYINNYYPSLQHFTCFNWTWYLANDMQMFLILPWVLALYIASNLAGTLFIVLLFAGNFASTFYTNYHYDQGAWSLFFNKNPKQFMQWLYIVPWVRITPYLMGICLAIWFYNYKQYKDHKAKIQKNPDFANKAPPRGFGYKLFRLVEKSNYLSWVLLVVGFGFTFYGVFGNYDFNKSLGQAWSRTGKAFYTALDRGIFISGLIMVLIPMLVGKLTWLTIALSNSVFAAMAKVTYSVYLLHVVFLMVFAGSQKSAPYLTHIDAVIACMGALFFSYLVGFALTVLVDAPLQNIDKTFIFPSKKNKKKP